MVSMMRINKHSRVFFNVVTFNYGMNYQQNSDKGIASLASWLRLSFVRCFVLCICISKGVVTPLTLGVKL